MTYFISYSARRGCDSMTGRCDFTTTIPLTGSDRLDVVEEQLKRDHGYESVTVTGWQRYEEPA